MYGFSTKLKKMPFDAAIAKVTEAMIAVEGEAMRPVTWVRINEIEQGDWAIGGQRLNAADVQATLTEFTAHACVNDVLRHAADASELIVCGGGALNGLLMQRLQAGLPNVRVLSSAARGMPPLQVEAAAFAWLARQTVLGLPGNLPKVTGAQGARILGGIFKA